MDSRCFLETRRDEEVTQQEVTGVTMTPVAVIHDRDRYPYPQKQQKNAPWALAQDTPCSASGAARYLSSTLPHHLSRSRSGKPSPSLGYEGMTTMPFVSPSGREPSPLEEDAAPAPVLPADVGSRNRKQPAPAYRARAIIPTQDTQHEPQTGVADPV